MTRGTLFSTVAIMAMIRSMGIQMKLWSKVQLAQAATQLLLEVSWGHSL